MHHVLLHSPNTAVVLLTAFGNVPEAVRSMRDGAVDYLTKPVSFDELHTTSMRALERMTQTQMLAAPAAEPAAPAPMIPPPGTSIAALERMHLENTLVAANGNRTRAAAMLGISLRTMRNRIRAYGLPARTYAQRSHA
jgi:DNA-binding NtrC family response regulator